MLLYGKMPQTLSAKKAWRQARRRKAINLKTKFSLKKTLRQAQKKKTKASLTKAHSLLDQAAKKKIIHKRKAARLKSRLVKLMKKRG